MSRFLIALLSALLVISTLNPVLAKRFGGRSGSHSYPQSHGLSGGGGRHSYPSSHTGLSGSGSMSHGAGHSYPSSNTGLSGSGKGYPNTNTQHNTNHQYPAGHGLSGNTASRPGTTINNHYHYNPPAQITYTPVHGGPPMHYPVYHGTPPTYVYQYQNSGSKYGTVLAGLALLNLGTLGTSVYLASKAKSYKPEPGEICKFGVKKENGDYEETRIDCTLITSFIFENQQNNQGGMTNSTVITSTVTNTTIVNNGGQPDTMNTTLNANATAANSTLNANTTAANSTSVENVNNAMTSTVITTSNTTTTVTNALDVKGKALDVTPGMQCYVIRHSKTSDMKRAVPCGLLQSYAVKSIQKNSGGKAAPTLVMLTAALAAFAVY